VTELEMLQALGLNKFLDPSNLVDSVIDRRNNPIKGIGAPWSKLQGGLFEIPRQGVTLVGGYSGHQKSTLANQWALHAANTGSFWRLIHRLTLLTPSTKCSGLDKTVIV
jgi:hypothetical protein